METGLWGRREEASGIGTDRMTQKGYDANFDRHTDVQSGQEAAPKLRSFLSLYFSLYIGFILRVPSNIEERQRVVILINTSNRLHFVFLVRQM